MRFPIKLLVNNDSEKFNILIFVERCNHVKMCRYFLYVYFLLITLMLFFPTFNDGLLAFNQPDKMTNSAFTVFTNVSSEDEDA